MPRKQQPYNPHINQHNTHEIIRRNNLILMMQRSTNCGTSTNHPTVDITEPNLSSTSHPHAIFQAWMWDLIKHINQNHPGLPGAKPPQPVKQWFHLMVRHHKTIIRLASTQAFQGSRAFVPTKASRTSNSAHNLLWASKVFFQPGLLGLVSQPTKGF